MSSFLGPVLDPMFDLQPCKEKESIPAYCFKGSFPYSEKDMASGRKGKAARAVSQQITLYSR